MKQRTQQPSANPSNHQKLEILRSMKRSLTPQIFRKEPSERRFLDESENGSGNLSGSKPTRDKGEEEIDTEVQREREVQLTPKKQLNYAKTLDGHEIHEIGLGKPDKFLSYLKKGRSKIQFEEKAKSEAKTKQRNSPWHEKDESQNGFIDSREKNFLVPEDPVEMEEDEKGLQGILLRFDDFITKLKSDQKTHSSSKKRLDEEFIVRSQLFSDLEKVKETRIYSEMSHKMKENSQKTQRNSGFSEKIEAQEASIKELQREISIKEMENKNLKLKLHEKEEVVRRVYEQRSILAKAIGIEKDSGDDLILKNLLQKNEMNQEVLSAPPEQLVKKLKLFLQENFILKKQNDQLKKSLENLREIPETLFEKKDDGSKEKMVQMDKQIQEISSENKDLKGRIENLTKSLRETEKELEKARNELKEDSFMQISQAQAQFEKMGQEKSKSPEEESEKLQKQVKMLQNQIQKERREFRKRMTDLQSRLVSSQALYQSKNDVNLEAYAKFEEKVAELVQIKGEKEKLSVIKMEQDAKIKRLAKELQKEKDTVDSLSQKEREMTEKLRKMAKQIEVLKKEKEESRKIKEEFEKAKRSLGELEREKERNLAKIEEKQRKIDELLKDIEAVEAERDAFKEKSIHFSKNYEKRLNSSKQMEKENEKGLREQESFIETKRNQGNFDNGNPL